LEEEVRGKKPGRRGDEERPPGPHPTVAEVANVGNLDLTSRQFQTKFGGLFLFLPFIASIPFDKILNQAGFPGSKMIPAGHAVRSLLALKLFGSARRSHVMNLTGSGFDGHPLPTERLVLAIQASPRLAPKVVREFSDGSYLRRLTPAFRTTLDPLRSVLLYC